MTIVQGSFVVTNKSDRLYLRVSNYNVNYRSGSYGLKIVSVTLHRKLTKTNVRQDSEHHRAVLTEGASENSEFDSVIQLHSSCVKDHYLNEEGVSEKTVPLAVMRLCGNSDEGCHFKINSDTFPISNFGNGEIHFCFKHDLNQIQGLDLDCTVSIHFHVVSLD